MGFGDPVDVVSIKSTNELQGPKPSATVTPARSDSPEFLLSPFASSQTCPDIFPGIAVTVGVIVAVLLGVRVQVAVGLGVCVGVKVSIIGGAS